MKPAQFLYRDPMTVAEALDLLAEYGEDARLLAGGQSLVPLLNFRLVQPAVIIDLNGIDELGNIQVADDSFRIGSMARQAAVENHRDIIRGWPLLIDALRHVAHPPIRNRGTIGGSLAHNDPAAELPAVMIVLGAHMILQSATAQRTVPAEKFFVSPLETLLAPDELLIAIEAPVQDPSAGWGFAEISRRHGDFALAAAAVQQIPGDAARTPGARIVVTGVAERPLRLTEAENILCEGTWNVARDKAIRAAVETAVEPFEDLHAPGWYRQQAAGVIVARACQDAVMRGTDLSTHHDKKPGAVA